MGEAGERSQSASPLRLGRKTPRSMPGGGTMPTGAQVLLAIQGTKTASGRRFPGFFAKPLLHDN